MPRYTIWIRKEDDESWRSIKDKPEFIHGALSVLSSPGTARLYAEVLERKIELKDDKELAELTFGKDCEHVMNKRTGLCEKCGEYVR